MAAMNPCAWPIIDVSCLSCPFARCLPSLVLPLGPVFSSEVHVVGLVSVEGLVGVPPLLLLVLVFPPLLLEACSVVPRRTNCTRKAPILATIRTMSRTVGLVQELILCCP